MRIPMDRSSAQPLYRQIETYLRQSIVSGSLPPETRLPASRRLAGDLGVNRITVERAYAELEADGLIYTRLGSGTYTLPPDSLPAARSTENGAVSWPLWQQELRKTGDPSEQNVPEDLQPPVAPTDLIALDSGSGDPQLFPVDEFRKVLPDVMRHEGRAALDYGDYRGYAPLRRVVAHVLTSQGIQANPDQILITSGSQQSLSLVSQLLLDPGDTVLVENPTYSGVLDLFRNLKLKVVGIPVDAEGMQVKQLEKVLQQHHPRLIYTMPNFHNPTGVCLTLPRRRQFLALAARYNAAVLEDDFVGELRYEGRTQPALKALDSDGSVIYTSTFSKMLMPGLRMGFLVAEGPVYDRLVTLKRLTDLASSNLIQHALAAYVTIGRYQTHLRRSIRIYRKRRDAMITALTRCLPKEAHFETPQGGLFIWLRLPDGLSSDTLLRVARQDGVTFAPGTRFFLDPAEGAAYLRLNFAAQPPEAIETGIERLGQSIRRGLPRPR